MLRSHAACVQRIIKSTGRNAATHTTSQQPHALHRPPKWHGNDLNDDSLPAVERSPVRRGVGMSTDKIVSPIAACKTGAGSAPPIHRVMQQSVKPPNITPAMTTCLPDSRHWPGPNQPVTRKQSPVKSAQHHSCHWVITAAPAAGLFQKGSQRAPSHPKACAPPEHLKRATS